MASRPRGGGARRGDKAQSVERQGGIRLPRLLLAGPAWALADPEAAWIRPGRPGHGSREESHVRLRRPGVGSGCC